MPKCETNAVSSHREDLTPFSRQHNLFCTKFIPVLSILSSCFIIGLFSGLSAPLFYFPSTILLGPHCPLVVYIVSLINIGSINAVVLALVSRSSVQYQYDTHAMFVFFKFMFPTAKIIIITSSNQRLLKCVGHAIFSLAQFMNETPAALAKKTIEYSFYSD